MKVKHLNYSSMYNTNSVAYAADQLKLTNFSNRVNQKNVETMKSIYANQSEAIKLQSAANLVNSVLDFGKSMAGVYDTYKKAKLAEEASSANMQYSSVIADLEKWKADWTSQGNSLYGDDLKTPVPEFQEQLNVAQGRIDGLGFSSFTQRNMSDAFENYKTEGWMSNVANSIDALNEKTSAQRNDILNSHIQNAIRNGGDTKDAFDYIDSLKDLPEATRDMVKANVAEAVKQGTISQNARLITDSDGFNNAEKYLKDRYDNGDITLDEYDQYKSQMYTRHNNNLVMAQKAVVDTYNEEMQLSGSPVTARGRAQDIINSAPKEDREKLIQSLDEAAYGVFAKNNQWLNDVPYMNNDQIQEKRDEVEKDSAGFFFGMDGKNNSNDYKSAVLKSLDAQMEKNKATEAADQSKDYKSQKEYVDSVIKNATLNLKNGNVSAYGFISTVKGAVESSPLLKNTVEGDNMVQTAINQLTDNILPSWYKDHFKSRVNDTIKALGDLSKYGVDQLDLQKGIEAKVLDFLMDYGNNEWGKAEIDSFLDSFGKEEFGKALEALQSTPEIKWGGGYTTDSANMKSYIKVLNAMASGQMYYTMSGGDTADGAPNMGKVKGITAQAQDDWMKASGVGEWTINQIFGEGFVNSAQARPMTITSGGSVITTLYYPTYLGKDGKLYSVIPNKETNGLRIVSNDGNGEWAPVVEMNNLGNYSNDKGELISIFTGKAPTYDAKDMLLKSGYYGTVVSKDKIDQVKKYNEEVSKLVSENVPIQGARYQAWSETHPDERKRKNDK